MKKELNKWQIHFRFGKDYRTMEHGWKQFEFGILKIVKFPEQGDTMYKPNYQGFLIKFLIWFPVDS